MKRRNCRDGRRECAAWIASAAATTLAMTAANARAVVVYESAEMGPIGRLSGAQVSSDTFIGVRFQVFAPLTADRMGGHFGSVVAPTSTLFGALVQLSSPIDFPDSNDLSTPDVLRTTVLTASYGSNEVYEKFTPISLNAGWYAIVFGSGKFGAT